MSTEALIFCAVSIYPVDFYVCDVLFSDRQCLELSAHSADALLHVGPGRLASN